MIKYLNFSILLLILFFLFSFSNCSAQVITSSNSINMSATVPSSSPAVVLINTSSSSGSIPFKGGILIFKGYAYPEALIFLKNNNQVISNIFADKNGFFEISLTQLNIGNYNFTLGAQEILSKDYSIIYKFNINVEKDSNIIISGIVFPPTFHLDKIESPKASVVKFFGRTIPNSTVILKLEPSSKYYSIKADNLGNWVFFFNTNNSLKGDYEVKAKTSFVNLISEYAEPIFLEINETIKIIEDKKDQDIISDIDKKDEIPIIEIPLYPNDSVLKDEEIIEEIKLDSELKIVYSFWLFLILILIPILLFYLRRIDIKDGIKIQ